LRHAAGTSGVEVGRWADHARLVDLPQLRAFVTHGCRRAGASEDVGFRLALAAHEVAANVLLHGYLTGTGWLAVELRPIGEGLELSVRDRAAPFDPTTFSRIRAGGDPEDLRGRGLQLVRQLVDRIEHRRVEGTNHLRLTIGGV